MVGLGSYILSAALLATLVISLGVSAVGLRRWLLPEWEGAPARLVESIVAVALLIWLAELLGVVNLLYAGTLVAAAILAAAAIAVGPRVLSRGGGPGGGLDFSRGDGEAVPGEGVERKIDAVPRQDPHPAPPAGGTFAARVQMWLPSLVAVGVVALVFAHWGLTAKDALGRGVFNFDSLWYHLPFAVEMAHSHSVTGIHYTETVFTNWFYPQNSELLHSVGILLTGRDTLSLFLNFGWLGMAFLAAWCIGRPYGRGSLSVVAAGVLLECHTLVVREPGAAKNDLMAAALLLAAIAILVTWKSLLPRASGGGGAGTGRRSVLRPNPALGRPQDSEAKNPTPARGPHPPTGPAGRYAPLAIAGLATGLAVGTKSTALAMAAMLTLAVIVLAPAGRRWAATGWWFGAGLAGGGYWYLRNLIVTGNPLPQLERLGPLSLPHPERLQEGRPDFSIAHYATDTGIWREYFEPGLHQAFGALWPVVLLAAIAGAVVALVWGRPPVLRWMGAVALVGMIAYVFTPLSAAGADGAPTGFGINIRYAIPALLAGLTLFPPAFLLLRRSRRSGPAGVEGDQPHREPAVADPDPPAGGHDRTRGLTAWSLWDWCLLGGLLVLLVVTNRSDAALRDPDRLFAWLIALLAVLIPAALVFIRQRPFAVGRAEPDKRRTGLVLAGFVALGLALLAIGYPVQRDYLRDRYVNANPQTAIPGMHLDSAYRWARGVHDSRIGLAGTTAGFLEYGLYGTDLSNRVRYLGEKGSHGAFNAIPTCAGFRAAVNRADLDYLVTAPFLDFIEPENPVSSPEARWLRGEPTVTPIRRSGPVTVWRVEGRLDPAGCGPRNAPLREVPDQPSV